MSDMTKWSRAKRNSGRVLFPPIVEPHESLLGLLLRTASDNLHGNVGAILRMAGYPHAQSFDLAIHHSEHLAALATVLGVEPHIIERLTHPIQRVERGVRTIDFLGAEVAEYDLITRRRRVSPLTLKNAPFHRAVWTHGLLPYCPHSLELLIDVCPACNHRLGWFRANGVQNCANPTCEADLTSFAPKQLPAQFVSAYRRMASLVAPKDAAGPKPLLHDNLATLNSGIVFEAGWRLAGVLTGAPVPRNLAKRLPAEQIAQRLISADRIICGWPGYFRTAIQTALTRDGTAGTGNLLRARKRPVSRVLSRAA